MNHEDMNHEDTTDPVDGGDATVDPFATVASHNAAAAKILGGYRLIDRLGEGGMGVVYEAEPVAGGSRVALKTLQSGSAATLVRLKAEFRVLTDLAHPNLVQLGELDTTSEQPFFTMEIVRGIPFDQYVSASLETVAAIPALPYSEDRLRSALLQLAKGLHALHGVGLVHRDIKPSNVMVTSEGRVVILDMGLTVAADELGSQSGNHELAGTPYYMAPEQMRGESITPACDWYAVGVILYEVLTGEKIFHARQMQMLLREKVTTADLRPRNVQTNAVEDLSDLCEQLLDALPERRPGSAEVLRRLEKASSPSIATAGPGYGSSMGAEAASTDSSVWIGRGQELETLRHAWQETRQGISQIVLVSGPSGIGKTALVDHFLGELRRSQPVVVLRGRCYENEAVPYRGIDSIVDSLANHLQRLPRSEVERVLPLDLDVLCQVFPVLKGVSAISKQLGQRGGQLGDARDLGQRGISALRELLNRLSRFESVVLFIDDLQQGDDDTATVFREIFRRDQAPPLLCLATFRSEDEDSSSCLRRIRRQHLSVAEQALLANQLEIRVDKFTRDESIRLASSLLALGGSDTAIRAERIALESAGDPLFIRMLAEAANSQSQQRDAIAKDETGQLETGQLSLISVIRVRIRSLSNDELAAVEILATAGRPLDADDLETLAGTREEVVGLVRSLRAQRLVRRLGDRRRVELFHDKIRETLLGMLPPKRQVHICLNLALHIERAEGRADVELLADLFRRGGDAPKAGKYFEQSAKIAEAAFAFNRAIECYRYAIDFLKPNGQHEVDLRKGLGDALANSARSAEAAKQYLLAAEMSESNQRARFHQLAALRYLTSGHVEEGTQSLRQVLDHYQLPWPESKFSAVVGLLSRNARLRIRGLEPSIKQPPTNLEKERLDACWSAAAGLSLVDPLRGTYYIGETLLRSLNTGSSETLPRDLAAFISQIAIGGSRSRRATRRVLLASRRQGKGDRDAYEKAMPLMSRGIAALLRGNWDTALKCCDRAVEYLTSPSLASPSCYGKTWELNTARTFALWSLQYQGNLVELGKRQPELLVAAIEANDLFATLNFGTQVMAHLQLASDHPEESLRRLEQDKQRLSKRGFFVQHHNYVLASTYTYLYQGQPESALKAMEGQWRNYQKAFLSQIQQVRIDHHQVLIRALIAAAAEGIDRGRNLKRAGRLIRSLYRERVGWGTALATAFEAASHFVMGRRAEAATGLEKSSSLFQRQSMRLFEAAARHHLGTMMGSVETAGSESAAQPDWSSLGVTDGDKLAATLLPGFDLE